MKLKVSELKAVLKNQLLFETPRSVGNPIQWNAVNWEQYLDFIKTHTGRAICFTSHNSFPELNQLGDPTIVKVNKVFTDLDDADKPENALLDVNKLVDFCEKWKLGCWDNFSGSKGFHHYFELKPKKYYLNRDDFKFENRVETKLRALHNWLALEGAKLRTNDIKCKDPRRLCRIPMSKYVSMKKRKKGDPIIYLTDKPTYCSPLTRDMLSMEIGDIIAYAANPVPYIVKRQPPKYTLDGLIDKLGFDVKEWALRNETHDEDTDEGQVIAKLNKIPNDAFVETVKQQIPRLCIQNDLFSLNPSHASRRIAVILLKRHGLNFREVLEWFDKLAHACGWVDRAFRDVRVYQIRHIFFRYPEYHPDACGRIKYVHKLCPFKDKRETKYPNGKCRPIKELLK